MKYRIKCNDSWGLFFTPFAFLNMGGTVTWVIQQKKYWLSKWETIERFDNKVDAYIKYFKLAYNLNVKKTLRFPHNKEKGKKVWCELTFQHNNHPIGPEYTYTVGYKPRNYAHYYHACYSGVSYEEALHRLYWDLEIKKLINKNKKNDDS